MRWLETDRASRCSDTVADMTADVLTVYYSLPMELKVALLKKPHGTVPAELVPRLSELPGTAAAQTIWLSNSPSDAAFTLHGELPDRLDNIRVLLDLWWSNLDFKVQNHLIENRDSELDSHYKGAIMHAGDGKPDGLIVAVVQDQNTGRFRLPPPVGIYLELKAREAEVM
jgi:hypothetical protein